MWLVFVGMAAAQTFAGAGQPVVLDGGPGCWVTVREAAGMQNLTLVARDGPTDELIMRPNGIVRPNDYTIMAEVDGGKLTGVGTLSTGSGQRWAIVCLNSACRGEQLRIYTAEPVAVRGVERPASRVSGRVACTVLADVDKHGHVRDGVAYGCPREFASAINDSVDHWSFAPGVAGTRRFKYLFERQSSMKPDSDEL
jgi:hypothetical protein